MVTMAAQLGIMAVGISFLMISGEFDLSVGSVYCFSPMILAMLVAQGIPPVDRRSRRAAICRSGRCSNGLITLKMGIPSFITTLGMMMIIRGIILAITGGFPITYKPQSAMDLISMLNLRFGETNFRASASGSSSSLIVFSFILDRTRYGNWVLATGGDQGHCRGSGSELAKTKLINFIRLFGLAGFSGIVNMGRFLTIEADLGDGMELEAIAAAVIGGNLLSGGYGSITGSTDRDKSDRNGKVRPGSGRRSGFLVPCFYRHHPDHCRRHQFTCPKGGDEMNGTERNPFSKNGEYQ